VITNPNRQIVSVISILMIALAACTPPANIEDSVLTPTPEVANGGEAIADTDQTDVDENVLGEELPVDAALDATYSDEQAGFSFNYPGSWHVQNDPGFTANLTSYPTEEEDGEIGEGETLINFVVLDSEQQFDALVETQRQEITAAGGTVSEESTLQLGEGGSAHILIQSMDDGAESIVAITQIANTNLLISGQGDLTHFNAIVESLRPVA
jgi:hypothetical protein